MWDFLKNLKDFLSLNYRSLFIISSLCWIVVFIPTPLLTSIGLLEYWKQYRPWGFGLGILFTTWLVVGWIFDLFEGNKDKFISWIKSRKSRVNREKILLGTSRVEREVLLRYLTEDTTTLDFDYRDGIVNGLIIKGVLYRASNDSVVYDFDTNIQSWAWDYLKNHPEFFEGIQPNKVGRHHIRF